MHPTRPVAALLLAVLSAACGTSTAATGSAPSAPVLWISDLYEPVNDPDDHYDLAVSMALPAYRPTMVVLDNHLDRQTGSAPAVSDLAGISGQPTPPVVMDSDLTAQLGMLSAAPDESVTVVSLGAATALGDLLRADRALVQRKVDEVLLVAGDAAAGAPVEYNVVQDPDAFLLVMTTPGLGVRWVPAFDGGLFVAGTASYTSTRDDALLAGLRPAVRGWFDTYISSRYGSRSLYASGLLTGDSPNGATWHTVTVRLNEAGMVDPQGQFAGQVERLVVRDRATFMRWMVESTNAALLNL